MALYQAYAIIAFFWIAASFSACMSDENDVIQFPAASQELLDESSRGCTADITRTGKRCRCNSPCKKFGGDNKVRCYIHEDDIDPKKPDHDNEYCCTSKCTLQYNLHSVWTIFRKLGGKSNQCDAGGIARVTCDPIVNTLKPDMPNGK